MDKITCNYDNDGSFLLGQGDDFIMTATENVVRRGSALFFILGGYVEIYENEAEALRAFDALAFGSSFLA